MTIFNEAFLQKKTTDLYLNESDYKSTIARREEMNKVVRLFRSCVKSVGSKDIIVTVMDASWYNKNTMYLSEYEDFIERSSSKIVIASVDCWTENNGHDEPFQEIMKLLKQKISEDPNLGRVYSEGYKRDCEVVYVSNN